VLPAVLAGVFGGRAVLQRLNEQVFVIAVLVLSIAGAVKLLLP
jgi:hypothetical protein